MNRVKATIIDGLASAGVTEMSIADELHMTARNLHREGVFGRTRVCCEEPLAMYWPQSSWT